jgi:glycerol-3-phosphate O-acyltransferase
MSNSALSHIAFEALDQFKINHKRLPGVWSLEDAEIFVGLCKEISKRYDMKPEEFNAESFETKFFYLFSFSC